MLFFYWNQYLRKTCIFPDPTDRFLSAPAALLDMKALQYLVSYHGKTSLKMKLFFSLPRDSKQASFSDSFCITVSSIACNFTENKPRVGRGRTYTVKIFKEIIRYCYFFFQVITYRKTRNLSVKICHAPLLICMEYIWTHDIFRLTLKLRLVSCWFELCILKI